MKRVDKAAPNTNIGLRRAAEPCQVITTKGTEGGLGKC